MTRAFALLMLGLAFGGGIGFVIGSSDSEPAQNVQTIDHSAHAHAHGELLQVSSEHPAPELSIHLTPDPVSGWNLNIKAVNFRFAPEHAGGSHADGEGHAHIYVNGDKLARAYGTWFHLDALPVGPVELEVTLNSNDHRQLAVGDTPLSATLAFDNPG